MLILSYPGISPKFEDMAYVALFPGVREFRAVRCDASSSMFFAHICVLLCKGLSVCITVL
jgi:hypothetical protein